METVWRFLKKLNIELLSELEILLLGIHPWKSLIEKDSSTSMFIAVLFIIDKTWKQPKYLSACEQIKMWCVCVYTHTYTHTYIYTHTYTHTYYGILLSYKKE